VDPTKCLYSAGFSFLYSLFLTDLQSLTLFWTIEGFSIVRNIEAQGGQFSLCMPNVQRNWRTLRTLSSTTSHLISTILSCSEIAVDRSIELKLPLISNLCLGSWSDQVGKTAFVRSIRSEIILKWRSFQCMKCIPFFCDERRIILDNSWVMKCIP
jgi:hypothetical protein